MGILALDQLEPGMVVADAVKDRSGRLLVAEGAELTEKTLRVLKTWGILEVDIQGEDAAMSGSDVLESLDQQQLEELKSNVLERFKFNEMSSPFTSSLFELVLEEAAIKFMEDK